MKLSALYSATALLGVTFLTTVFGSEETPSIVVMGYNSYDAPIETLIFASIKENEGRAIDGSDQNIQSVGLGSHLWAIDEDGPELKRGWMFRLRLTMQHVKDEYERRGQEDFVVVVADATDVFVKESLDKHTLDQLNERFLTQFADSKIVFSTQIYCCNPFKLSEFGRRDWDMYYDKRGDIPSMYKHLNAGTFMGYASALIDMADEMKLWNTTYHRHESYHSLAGLETSKSLHMIDLEVDDDEWQLATWFFQDQEKSSPLSALDYNQDLFGVTGTFRAQETEDSTYVVFSRDHFYSMFGEFPVSFNKETDMSQLVVCPYKYDEEKMEFTNEITGGNPLVFHFAGNDWLCACTIFEKSGFQNVPKKFHENCAMRLDPWFDRVQEGILDVAEADDADEAMYLPSAAPDSVRETEEAVQDKRALMNIFDSDPYNMKPPTAPKPVKKPIKNPTKKVLKGMKKTMKKVTKGTKLTTRDLQRLNPYRKKPVQNILKRIRKRFSDRDLQKLNPYQMKPAKNLFSRLRKRFFNRDLQKVNPNQPKN